MNSDLITGREGIGVLRAHGALVRTGAILCALAAASMAVAGLAAGDGSLLVRAAVPAVVGVALVGMLLFATYPIVPLSYVTGALIVGSDWIYGSEVTQVPAMVGIVVVGAVLAVVVDRARRWRYLGPWALGVVVAPVLWHGLSTQAVALAAIGLGSYLAAASLAITVRNALALSDRRYRSLLGAVPVAVFEQDWAEAKAELVRLRRRGVGDLGRYLTEHPEVVRRLADTVRVVDANPAAVDIFGACDFDQVAGFMGSSRVTDDNLSHYVAQLVAIAEGAGSFRGVCRTETFDGQELWLDVHWVSTTELGRPEIGSVVVAATDITALKVSERSKDELIDSLSHELRTPLTAVLGFARLLSDERQSLDDADRAEMLESIAREGTDLANVVDDLLTIAKIERDAIRVVHVSVDLRAQVAQVLEVWDPAESAAIRVAGESPRALGDPGRIRQILRHLLANARRHGGDDILVEFTAEGSVVGVVVSDDGPGLPPGEEERIFRPHQRGQTGDGLAPSLGFGLAISRHLARLMGGDVVYRREGNRTVFELSLPAYAERPAEGERPRIGLGTGHR